MSDRFEIDTTELDQLTADLGAIPASAGVLVSKAVEVSARNVRDHWRDAASGFRRAPHYHRSITYDMSSFTGFGVTVLQAEIGPDKDRTQGALGNLIEYGSVNNPPHNQGQAALEAVQDDFEKGLDMALETAERHAGWGL